MTRRTLDQQLEPGILLFWSLWFSVVTATNICDGLKAMGVLPATWKLASGNLAFMRSVTNTHGTPELLVRLMFLGVVAWQVVASTLHWRAFLWSRTGRTDAGSAVRSAFVVSTALWAAFILADELFIAYAVESTHLRLFIAELASIAVLALLARRDDELHPHSCGTRDPRSR